MPTHELRERVGKRTEIEQTGEPLPNRDGVSRGARPQLVKKPQTLLSKREWEFPLSQHLRELRSLRRPLHATVTEEKHLAFRCAISFLSAGVIFPLGALRRNLVPSAQICRSSPLRRSRNSLVVIA